MEQKNFSETPQNDIDRKEFKKLKKEIKEAEGDLSLLVIHNTLNTFDKLTEQQQKNFFKTVIDKLKLGKRENFKHLSLEDMYKTIVPMIPDVIKYDNNTETNDVNEDKSIIDGTNEKTNNQEIETQEETTPEISKGVKDIQTPTTTEKLQEDIEERKDLTNRIIENKELYKNLQIHKNGDITEILIHDLDLDLTITYNKETELIKTKFSKEPPYRCNDEIHYIRSFLRKNIIFEKVLERTMTPEQAKEISNRFKKVYQEHKRFYIGKEPDLYLTTSPDYIEIKSKDNSFSNVFTPEYYNIEDGEYSIGIGITDKDGVFTNCGGKQGYECLTDYNTIKEKMNIMDKILNTRGKKTEKK